MRGHFSWGNKKSFILKFSARTALQEPIDIPACGVSSVIVRPRSSSTKIHIFSTTSLFVDADARL